MPEPFQQQRPWGFPWHRSQCVCIFSFQRAQEDCSPGSSLQAIVFPFPFCSIRKEIYLTCSNQLLSKFLPFKQTSFSLPYQQQGMQSPISTTMEPLRMSAEYIHLCVAFCKHLLWSQTRSVTDQTISIFNNLVGLQ